MKITPEPRNSNFCGKSIDVFATEGGVKLFSSSIRACVAALFIIFKLLSWNFIDRPMTLILWAASRKV